MLSSNRARSRAVVESPTATAGRALSELGRVAGAITSLAHGHASPSTAPVDMATTAFVGMPAVAPADLPTFAPLELAVTAPEEEGDEVAPEDMAARPTLWSDRRIGLALFVGVLCVYVAVTQGQFEVYDTHAMMGVTENLVNHGSLTSAGGGFPVATLYAPYGIAVSLLAVPSYVLSKWTGNFPLLASMIDPILTALSVVLIYRIARALDWRPSYGLVAAVGYGLCSMAVWYTTELLSEPGVTLCILVIMLGFIRWRQGRAMAPLWIGMAAGCAVQFRSDSLITVWIALLAAPCFVPWAVLRTRRTLSLLLGPMAVSFGLLGWYNELRFHKVLVGTYGPGGGFVTPLWHGLDGLLLSPGKGLFLFNPLTVLGVVGLGLLFVGPARVRNRRFGVLCLLLIVPRTLLFAKWDIWDAGSVWGPRFLLPVVPVLALGLAPVLQATDRRRTSRTLVRSLAVALASVAAFINFLSVRLFYGEWLGAMANPYWRAVFGIRGPDASPGHAQVDFRFVDSPIWGDITLIRHHIADVAGMWWVIGHGVVGWTLLEVGALILVTAAVGTHRTPGFRSRPETESAPQATSTTFPAGSGDVVTVAGRGPGPHAERLGIHRRPEPAGQGTQRVQRVSGQGPPGHRQRLELRPQGGVDRRHRARVDQGQEDNRRRTVGHHGQGRFLHPARQGGPDTVGQGRRVGGAGGVAHDDAGHRGGGP